MKISVLPNNFIIINYTLFFCTEMLLPAATMKKRQFVEKSNQLLEFNATGSGKF